MHLEHDIFFYHIQKTAGTTMVRLLEQIYGSQSCCPLPTHETADQKQFRFKVKTPHPLVISGHPDHLFELWQQANQRLFPRFSMTFLRHPVDRYLSCYYFIRQSNYVQNNVKKFSLSLEQAISCNDHRLADNIMTKVLANPGKPKDYLQPASKQDLLVASQNIENMNFVGLVEKFNLSYALLCSQLKVTPQTITKWNVNQKYPNRHEIDLKLKNKIMLKNIFDYELYNFAKQIFEEKILLNSNKIQKNIKEINESKYVYMVKQYKD